MKNSSGLSTSVIPPKSGHITRKFLAKRLGISRSTLYRWMKEYDVQALEGLISPKEARRIEEELDRKRIKALASRKKK